MSMTIEQAKSELMQIYGALSPDKQRAIDTLVKIEPCEDAISRQAVINLIRRCNSALEEPRIFESHHSGNIFEHYITKLPPVNPQDPKHCDRNICIKNEYNGIGCDNTWKQARQEWESEDK